MPSMSSIRRKTVLTCATVAAALAALPALAGTVYLPHAEYRQQDGKINQVLLWATNPTAEPRTFTLRFIPSGTDGGQSATAPTQYQVPAGATIPVGAAPFGAVGMAAVSGYDHLAFSGELNVLTLDNRLITSTEVPLVGSADVLRPQTWSHLVALERDHGVRTTDLGLVNLGPTAGTCTVASFRADGSLIAAPTLALQASGHRLFEDAFGLLGEPQLDGGRFQINCSVPFWIYAVTSGRVPEFVKLALPAATAQSTLLPPGSAPPSPPANTPPPSNPPPSNPPPSNPPPPPPSNPPPGASGELLRRDGTFLNATVGNSYLELNLPIARGQRYRSITVEFDVAAGKYPTNLFVGTVGMMRPVRGGTYYAHTVRADRGKSILDMGVGDGLVHRGDNNVWAPNTNYRVRVHYNAAGRQVVWELFRGGQLLERMVGGIGNANLVHNGEGLKVFFGLDKPYDNAFFPPWGWRFSNLVVRGQAQ